MKSINMYAIYLCFLILNINNLSADASQTVAVSGPAAAPAASATTVATPPAQKSDNIAANWTAAVTAFGGPAGISLKTASKTMPTSMTSTSLGYADAEVIVQFLNDTPMHAIDTTNLNNALVVNQSGDNIPANWTAAITAFGGSAGISAKTASKTMPTSMTATSTGYADAQVILQSLNGIAMNSTDTTNLTNALAANPAPAPTPAPTPAPAPAVAATPTVTPAATPAVPTPDIKKQQIIVSVYLQNNYEQDATLTKIEFLLAHQTTPTIKSNLNIPIKSAKNIYSKGSITAFDITTETNGIQSFNGIQSITIGDDQIVFKDIKTGVSLSHPIVITKNNGHWVTDQQL